MRLVSVSMLKPDMVLAKSIYYNDSLLLREGQDNLNRFSLKLQSMGIYYVYIEDTLSNGIDIPDVISEDTRVACKRILKQTLDDYSNNKTINVERLSDVISKIIDDLFENPDVQISLNDICSEDDYTFSHSVSTTVYALMLAMKLNYSRPMLEKLAAGTLLHDIGKLRLDKNILSKVGHLTDEEYEHIKTHTLLGYDTLKKYPNISELSRIVSLYHHERMDGTGYPTGTSANKLHEFSRIVAIADVYDALTSDRCYRKKWSASKAANYLMECSDTKFDTRLVAKFLQLIAIYPNGSLVRLSNHTLGIIKDQNHGQPLRPIVRVFSDENGNELDIYEIDLMKELNITILESELEIDEDNPNQAVI